jgi:predicted transcriptional regulator
MIRYMPGLTAPAFFPMASIASWPAGGKEMKCGPQNCPITAHAALSPSERIVQRQSLARKLYERDFTQEQIAEQLGVSQTVISRDLDGLFVANKPPRPKGGRPKGSNSRRKNTGPDAAEAAKTIIEGKTYKEAASDSGHAATRKAKQSNGEGGQREVMMFGVRLWPIVEHQFTYDYDQLCAAIWYFRDFDNWLKGTISGRNPGSRAIIARLSTRWPQEYIGHACPADETRGKIKKVYQLVHLLAGLLEKNPEGECVVSPSPMIEGQR